MDTQVTYDVSHLPASGYDSSAPVWWGNLLLILIETTTIAMLAGSYFYVRQNYTMWPPPQVHRDPPIQEPLPDLQLSTINVLLLVASCAPTVWVDKVARRKNTVQTVAGLALLTIVGVAAITLRIYEFPGLKFWWDENAYASVVWSILGMHLIYLIFGFAEVGIMLLWILLHGLDEKHAVDVTLTAGYWYWMAGIWVPLYAIVYWAPHVL